MPDDDWADCGGDEEAARVARRRRALKLPEAPPGRTRLALALSGGGLRSAAFSLGVMQALAEATCPASATPTEPGTPPATPAGQSPSRSLLARVDYLSTVGSGGYIGAFFVSLFVPGRLVPGSSPREAAESAYRGLQDGPPPSVGGDAMAWLRRHGGAPGVTGIGDRLLAAAVVVRNWLAMQCILGSMLLAVLAVLALALHLVIGAWPGVGRDEMALLYAARRAFNENLPAIWWSEYLWLPIVSALLLAVPPALACCLVYPFSRPAEARQRTHVLGRAALLTGIAGALVLLETFKSVILVWLAVATCLVILLPAPRTVAMYRARATRALRGAATLTIALTALGVADTIARSWYLYGSMAARPWSVAGPAMAAVALAWVVHHRAAHRDAVLQGATAGSAGPRWRRGTPLLTSLLTVAAATTLALLLVALWSWIVLWVRWDGGEPVDWLVFGKAWTTPSLLALALAALALAIAVGRGSGLLNLSSLQPLHAARITRAFLGASNRHDMDGADPAPDDALPLETYYDPRTLAPLHLLNVTLNETIDAAGQRMPPHRRARPLCVGPGSVEADGRHVRFSVDGKPCREAVSQPEGALHGIGHWIALSGCALPIGPATAFAPGASLLMGLANLRPGIWWQGRMAAANGPPSHPGWAGRLFRTQYQLLCELTARFHGMRGDWQYLSDGGHFDDTAVYELLRPERRVGLIVLCDGGGHLVNLIWRARADFGLEIEVDHAAAHDAVLGECFGTPADFEGEAKAGDRFAMLLNVSELNSASRTPLAHIIVIQPRLPVAASDGFSGEIRWEDYRLLGQALGRRVTAGPIGARLFAQVS
jgi:hypothetical protein